MADAELQILIKAKNEAKKEFDNLNKQVTALSGKGTSGISGLNDKFKSLTGVSIGAAGAITLLAKGLKQSINDAMEAERSEKRLTTALESTRYAAGLSKESLMSYANAMEKVTMNSAETVMNAQSVMLTFTKVGKEIFPQAIEAAMDMSAAFGGDLQSSVIQLGKALNDPNGMAAMKRIGVSFSDAQMDMAKAMYEAGDVAGYQAVIMKELNIQVGGMAKAMGTTYAGQVEILKNNIGELTEQIGKFLIPYLSDAARALNGLLTVHKYWENMVKDAPGWMSRAGISYDEYRRRVMDTAMEVGELTKRQREYYEYYSQNMSNPMNVIWIENMNEKLGIQSQAAYEARGTVGLLAVAWEDYRNSLNGIPEAQEEISEELRDLTSSFKDLTAEMIYNELAASLDRQGQLDLARQLGILNQSTYDAYIQMDILTEKFDLNKDGVIDLSERTNEYYTALKKVTDTAGVYTWDFIVNSNSVMAPLIPTPTGGGGGGGARGGGGGGSSTRDGGAGASC